MKRMTLHPSPIMYDVREMNEDDIEDAINHAETMVSTMLGGYAQAYDITGLEYGTLENARLSKMFVKNTLEKYGAYEHEFFSCFRNIDLGGLIHANGVVR